MHETVNHESEKPSTSWRDKTVKAAGYGYLIGDMAMAASGLIKGGTTSQIFKTGAIWSAGGIGAAMYGNPDVEKQLDILAHKLEKHLTKDGATVTDAVRSNTELLQGKNTLGAKLDRFLHEHPTELLNAAYAIGAGVLLKGSYNKLSDTRKQIEAGMGALVLSGALCGLLIKEDPNARDKVEHTSLVSRTVGYIKEKPMRLAGSLYLLNNGLGIANALLDKKDFSHQPKAGMKAHWFSFAMVTSYMVANGLLFISSRDQIQEKKFQPEHIAKLEQVAAEIIAAQPPQLQAALLADVSQFMATQHGVALPAEEIAHDLATRVTELTKDRMKAAADTVKSFAQSEIHRREAADAAPSLA